jgi:hypothetical protein
MRIPGSGSILESVLNGFGTDAVGGDDAAVDAVNDVQLLHAIDAMSQGDIEYVIIENGNEFVQAAGAGDGPFALEFSPASGAMQEVRGGVDVDTVRVVLLAYLHGDAAWRRRCAWSPR